MSMFDTGHGSNSLNSTRASVALETIAKNTKKEQEHLTLEQEKLRAKLTQKVIFSYYIFMFLFFIMLFIFMYIIIK